MSDRAALVTGFPAAFAPNWRARAQTIVVVGGAVGLYIFGLVTLDFDPSRIMRGFTRLGDIFGMMVPPTTDTWTRGQLYVEALIQTLAIAFLGTFMAAILAIPLGFLAARNIVTNWLLHILARRSLDTMRSVDTLIWALIWINVVGLGPFAGALAIMTSDIAAFGKLMSEAIETADRKPVGGLRHRGVTGWRRSGLVLSRRCCRYLPARFCISLNPTRGPPPSSVSSVPAALGFICQKKSGCWNGSAPRF